MFTSLILVYVYMLKKPEVLLLILFTGTFVIFDTANPPHRFTREKKVKKVIFMEQCLRSHTLFPPSWHTFTI